MSEIRVLIVDDDPMVLSSLRTYFKKAPHITVVGEASDGHKALNMVSKGGVDVVLTDIHMPEMDGVELLERIQRLDNPPKLIAITSFDTDETMIRILGLGGNGYILKTSRPEAIISTVEDVVQGGTVISPVSATRLIKTLPSRTMSEYDITETEDKVLSLVCQGQPNSVIAKRLQKSSGTVKKHLSALFTKFGATSRLDLALKAMEAGFKPRDIETGAETPLDDTDKFF